jgi:Rad3-related DNA helicase
LKDSILVFDEAHNIDSNCEEIYSFEIEIQQAWTAFWYLDHYSKNGGDSSLEESYDLRQRKKSAISVKCFLLKFINAIKNIELKNYRNALGSVQRCITNIFILDV